MGTVASIIGGVCAVIAFVGIVCKAYFWYRSKPRPRRNSPGSPKQSSSTINGSRCPPSFICPTPNELEQGVLTTGVPTTAASGASHTPLTASASGSKTASKVSQKSANDPAAVKSKSYSFEEMRTATNHFSNKIGEGRFGPVYHGQLSGQEVAVKVIARSSGQGASEFVREVDLVANLRHDNLVSLVGHCQESPHQMVIYECIHNGALRDHLHNQNTQSFRPALTWRQRLHIALGAAEALKYLHDVHKTGRPVTVHGDMKPGNILLDDKLNAKVSDFGISRFASIDNSGVPTQIFGTPGYLDPEFSTAKQLTANSDVYSLGVVLLELISGRPPIQLDSQGTLDSKWDLIEWARILIRGGNLSQLVDPALGGMYQRRSMAKVAELAMFSVEPQGVDRPKACKVVEGLLEAIALETKFHSPTKSPDDVSSSSSGAAVATLQCSRAFDCSSARMSTSARHSTADSEALISLTSTRTQSLDPSEARDAAANIIIQVDTR